MINVLVYAPYGEESLRSLSHEFDEEDWMGVNRISSLDGNEALEILRKKDIGAVIIRGYSEYVESEQKTPIGEFEFLRILLKEFPLIPRYYVCPAGAFALIDSVEKKYKTEAGMDISDFLESISG